ncbi:MAG TPA: energy transducer TonB, partial [Hymenobacter sp.]|nr:energy transducer TonB [Hymenobacter sp.]
FRPEQLAPKPTLRPKLRRFLVALVLVCGLGLTSSEAWAQVKAGATCVRSPELLLKAPEDFNPVVLAHEAEPVLPPLGPLPGRNLVLGMMMEQMPVYKNGGSDGLMSYIRKNLKYPAKAKAYGKVFISFVVTKTGTVKNVRVLKSLEPLLDAEVVRVVQQMGPWIPGKQINRPINVSYTLPVSFQHD